MIAQLLESLRRLWRGEPDRDLGRRWHARAERGRQAHASERRRAFLAETTGPRRSRRVLLGRAEDERGEHQWCGLPLTTLTSSHLGITGATGAGKSMLLAAIFQQLLRLRVPLVLADMKSELAGFVLEKLVPELVAEGRTDLVEQVRVIRPFDRARVPLLRLTEPERGVSPQVQSLSIAASLAESMGQDHGLRMQRIVLPVAGLAVEKNRPLPEISSWLQDPTRFAREAATSEDPVIRAYALYELPRENRTSLDAVRARLDLLFHLPEVRLALSAPHCLDFHACLDGGVTVLDLGSPPAGAEAAMRFIAGPIIGRLTRAILSREMRPNTPACVVCFEEVQELLGRHQIEQFKRLLSLARFKGASLWFSTQEPGRVEELDRTLLRSLRTNLGAEIVFRASIDDARRLSQGFLLHSPDESLVQARARFIEEIASLPRRSYFLWLKSTDFGPQRLRSPRLDLDALGRVAASVPAEVRQRILDGATSVDRRGLERELAAAERTLPARTPRIVPLEPEERAVRAPRLG